MVTILLTAQQRGLDSTDVLTPCSGRGKPGVARICETDVEGRVIRMSPAGSRHAVLATRLAVLLSQHTDAHGLGVVMTPGGFKLSSNPDTVREPDVAFVRRDRIPATGIPDGFWPGPPDLAVEIRSPGDRLTEILSKVSDYLDRGVRLVGVVDPQTKTVTTYRPDGPPITVGAGDSLDAGDVVPGLTTVIGQLFD